MPVGLELSWSPWGASHSSEQATPTYRPQVPCHRAASFTSPAGRPRGPIPPAPSLLSPSPLLSLERDNPVLPRVLPISRIVAASV